MSTLFDLFFIQLIVVFGVVRCYGIRMRKLVRNRILVSSALIEKIRNTTHRCVAVYSFCIFMFGYH